VPTPYEWERSYTYDPSHFWGVGLRSVLFFSRCKSPFMDIKCYQNHHHSWFCHLRQHSTHPFYNFPRVLILVGFKVLHVQCWVVLLGIPNSLSNPWYRYHIGSSHFVRPLPPNLTQHFSWLCYLPPFFWPNNFFFKDSPSQLIWCPKIVEVLWMKLGLCVAWNFFHLGGSLRVT
jgi:hypothetical protein